MFDKSAIFIAFCLWLAAFCANAAAQYRFDQLTTENGLPQNSVYSIVQTAEGYIWMATLDGLVRYDGVRFTVFNKSNSKNLLNNRLIGLLVDGENSVWLLHESNNLSRYRNGEFQTFSEADGLPETAVYLMTKDANGGILAWTKKGVARFDGNRFTARSAESKTFDGNDFVLYFSPSGALWEVRNQTLTRFKDGKRTDFTLPIEPQKFNSPGYKISSFVKLFEDRSGVLWFSLWRNHLYRLENETIRKIETDEIATTLILDIAQDEENNIWVGTDTKGVCLLSQEGFKCFDSTSGLSSNSVRGMFLDREGTLWVATDDRGVCRLSKQVITPFSTAQGLRGKNLYSIFEDRQGAIWLGSYGAAAKFEKGTLKNYGTAEGSIYQNIQSFYEDRESRLWIGAFEGVQYFKDGKFYDFKDKLYPQKPSFGVFDIEQDENGVLLFATTEGLVKYDGQTAKQFTTENGLPGNNVKIILKSRNGGYWIGTYSGIALMNDEKITAYTEKDGLAGNQVRALFEDADGTLWIGTYDSGLSRFKDGKFTNYNKENGLFSNGVFEILPDDAGNFWMSSNQGIYRVSRAELNDFADGKSRFITSVAFGKADGMLNAEANGGGQPTGLKTKDGRLWFPTQDGAAIVNPKAVKFNPLPPPVVIESARIDNQSAISNPKSRIEMSPNQENLEIDYTGLSFIKSEQMRFRYRLEGLDEDWTEAGTRRTAFYPHLAPGEYTFRVIAANSDNVWNEKGASIKITVIPPFYRTWWFVALCVLAFFGLAFMIYRRRINQLKKERAAKEEFSRRLIIAHESERRRVAAELHDSLGQTLAMIKNRAVFAVQNTKNLEAAKEQFEQITDQSVDAINEVREISYNLRPYLLDRLGLTKALKSLFNKTAENSNLKIAADIENIDKIFSKEEEMSLYRIVQENLNNILKHAEASEIRVEIKKETDFLTVKIADNGKGFSTDGVRNNDKKEGFGLLGMAERVNILGGTHNIESAPDKGTTVKIKISI